MRAWVISVNMGYGHDRAAYPLKSIAQGGIISANNYDGIPRSDKNTWQKSREIYERFSQLKKIPLVGGALFHTLDHWQEIRPFYPRRDLSSPTIQTQGIYSLLKKGFLEHLITKKLASGNLPIISTFFIPALAADYYGYQNDIYAIITDTDMSRAWVAKDPRKSKIKYLAPSRRVVERLKLYGVKDENIFLTGFPLPKENIGGLDYDVLRKDIGARIPNLDPSGIYRNRFSGSIKRLLGSKNLIGKPARPLTIMFAVGGAGAQKETAEEILHSLKNKIAHGDIRLILVAGSRREVADYFTKTIKKSTLGKHLGRGVDVLFSEDRFEYFKMFNKTLRNADILWTKPSELSFYAGLGVPIIMCDPVGSQEEFNLNWLKRVGAGIEQNDPKYTNEWLDDYLASGWLARAAMQGFVGAPKRGTYRIEDIIANKKPTLPEPIEPV